MQISNETTGWRQGKFFFILSIAIAFSGGFMVAMLTMQMGPHLPIEHRSDNAATSDLEHSIAALRIDIATLSSTMLAQKQSVDPGTNPEHRADNSAPQRADNISSNHDDPNAAKQRLVSIENAEVARIRTRIQQMPYTRDYSMQNLATEMAPLSVERKRELLSEVTNMLNRGEITPQQLLGNR